MRVKSVPHRLIICIALSCALGEKTRAESADGGGLGACCNTFLGLCVETQQHDCIIEWKGTFAGEGTMCSDTTCIGACCNAYFGFCYEIGALVCEDAGDIFMGMGTSCDDIICHGACCDLDFGDCYQTGEGECKIFGDVYHGRGTTCEDVMCRGACCTSDFGVCINTGERSCVVDGGTFLGVGSECVPDSTCVGACCGFNAGCALTSEAGCSGVFGGIGSRCESTKCSGACCIDELEVCIQTTELSCSGDSGVFFGEGSDCGDVSCGGACCLPACVVALRVPCDPALPAKGQCPPTPDSAHPEVCLPSGICAIENSPSGDPTAPSNCVPNVVGLVMPVCCNSSQMDIEEFAECMVPTAENPFPVDIASSPSADGVICGDPLFCCEPGELGGAVCEVRTAKSCGRRNGLFFGDGVGCGEVECTGPCCTTTGHCIDATSDACRELFGGEFQGFGRSCDDVDIACPEPTGACCHADGFNTLCEEGTTSFDCSIRGGTYQGDDSSCIGIACPTSSCPGEGSCCATRETPGCADDICCQEVCAIAPYCCTVVWDGVCAAAAVASCECGLAADWDDNLRIDMHDFAIFQLCFGDPLEQADSDCPPGFNADFDGDGIVSPIDYEVFFMSMTGPHP